MTYSHALVSTPDEVIMSFQHEKSCTTANMIQAKGNRLAKIAEDEDRRDVSARDESATAMVHFSESSTKDTSGKKCVNFDLIANQRTIRNLKNDLSRHQREQMWYTEKDIMSFSREYNNELNIALLKKKKSPVRKIKKLFSRGLKKMPTFPPAA